MCIRDRHGIMFKTAVSLEETGKAKVVVLDKTIVVAVEDHVKHPLYNKIVKKMCIRDRLMLLMWCL